MLDKQKRELLKRPGVEAVGFGWKIKGGKVQKGLRALVVNVQRKIHPNELSKDELIPENIEGEITDVQEIGGPIRARQLPDPTEHQKMYRPSPAGVSVGHYGITAGTLGCWVRKDGKIYGLSNNHVLADSNAGAIGDRILQPGPYDGGEETIGTLSEFVPLNFIGADSDCQVAGAVSWLLNLGCMAIGSRTRYNPIRIKGITNLVDAALFTPYSDMVKDEIFGLGKVTGWMTGQVGMNLAKSGRTSGVTFGPLDQVDVMTNVQYDAGKIGVFEKQFLSSIKSAGGDSGSLVVNADNMKAVGLLFAGSDTVTILNPIQYVIDALGGIEF